MYSCSILHVRATAATAQGETRGIRCAQLFVLNVLFGVADLGEIRWARAQSMQDCSVVTFCWMRLRCNFWILCYHFFYSRSATKPGRKLSKDSTKETIEKERPPWRTVIAATQPKVNKNALLKAKILDATRRALLAQKICHIGIQTEPSTTLVREQSIGVQKDLIRKIDKSMDTDGVVTIRRECPRGCKWPPRKTVIILGRNWHEYFQL